LLLCYDDPHVVYIELHGAAGSAVLAVGMATASFIAC
jgi:hypothetical protein